jgi:hypothetical protein
LYKIAERRYNRTVALIASILFAVMPITWLLRKILLESLILPLLLSSILFALYTKDQKKDYNIKNNKNIPIVLLSGIFLGLAILTKIPIFTIIPLAGYLVYISNNKNWRILGIWFIPVILIPLIWPVDSILNGDFNLWLNDVVWHAERQTTSDSPIGTTLFNSLKYLFQIEPILFIFGIAGIIFAEIKRDFMLLLWIIPFLIFLFIIDFVSFFHLILLFPALCIASARMIADLLNKISYKKIQEILPFVVIIAIGAFGLTSTTMLITTNVTSNYFEVYASIVQYLANEEEINDRDSNNNNNDNVMTMIGRHWTRGLFWIPRYVYDIDLDFKKVDNADAIPRSVETEKVILIVDNTIKRSISDNNNEIQNGRQQQLNLYHNTIPIATFKDESTHYDLDKYPYASMSQNRDTKWVETRVNANTSNILWDIY